MMTGHDFHDDRSRIPYSSSKIPGVRKEYLSILLLLATARILVSSVSLMYLVDEFFFLFLV